MSGALRYALALLAAVAIGGAPAVARAALLAPATADVVLVTRIVRVSDGDTVHAMINGRAVRVRLSAIDAPEAGQAFGEKARRALADMVTGRVSSCIESASTSTSALWSCCRWKESV